MSDNVVMVPLWFVAFLEALVERAEGGESIEVIIKSMLADREKLLEKWEKDAA